MPPDFSTRTERDIHASMSGSFEILRFIPNFWGSGNFPSEIQRVRVLRGMPSNANTLLVLYKCFFMNAYRMLQQEQKNQTSCHQ